MNLTEQTVIDTINAYPHGATKRNLYAEFCVEFSSEGKDAVDAILARLSKNRVVWYCRYAGSKGYRVCKTAA